MKMFSTSSFLNNKMPIFRFNSYIIRHMSTSQNEISAAITRTAENLEIKKNRLLSRSQIYPDKATDAIEKSFMKYAWHTNVIEGVDVNPTTVLGIRKATEYVQNNFWLGDLHSKIFQRIHELIMFKPEETLSGFREENVCIRCASGDVYVFPSYQLVPMLMEKFIEALNVKDQSSQLHPLILAAIIKISFVSIHPFCDGNGRTSRAIMNGLYRRDGYPFITVPVEESEKYYSVLETYNEEGNLNPYLEFILDCVKRSLEEYNEELS